MRTGEHLRPIQGDEVDMVDMEELHRKSEIARAKRKLDSLIEAARLIADWEPKNASTLYGKAAKAAAAWSRLAEPTESKDAKADDTEGEG